MAKPSHAAVRRAALDTVTASETVAGEEDGHATLHCSGAVVALLPCGGDDMLIAIY